MALVINLRKAQMAVVFIVTIQKIVIQVKENILIYHLILV